MSLLHSEYSLDFDGVNDHVLIGNVTELSFERTDTFSISLWMKASGSFGDYALTSKLNGTASYPGWEINTNSSSGRARLHLMNNSSTNRVDVQGGPDLYDGNWHHVCYTYSGSSTAAGVSLFIDGESVTISVNGDNLNATIVTANPVKIGQRGGSTAHSFPGNIDEVSFFDTELSASEVESVYNAGTPRDLTLDANLIGYYWMGDGDTYPTITDHSLSGNDGTMTNMGADDIVVDAPRTREASHSIELQAVLAQYVTMGHVSEVNFTHTDPFSISIWVKASNVLGGYLVQQGVFGGSPFRGWGLIQENDGLHIILYNNGNSNGIQATSHNIGLHNGEWHHVIFTYDGSTNGSGISFFMDSVSQVVSVTQDNLSATIAEGTAPLNINSRENGNAVSGGSYTDLTIWSRELSQSEVDALYNGGTPPDARTLGMNLDLQGYWGVDRENYPTVVDLSVNGNDGTATSTVASDIKLDAPGLDFGLDSVSTKSVEFIAGSEITVGTAPEYNFGFSSEFSVSCWFKTTSAAANKTLVSKFTTGNAYGWWLFMTGGKVTMYMASVSSNILRVETDKIFNDDVWHLATTTMDGTGSAAGLSIYIDGVQVPTTTTSDTLTDAVPTTEPLVIGSHATAGREFIGNLDDVVIYNKTLTEVEVRTLYGARGPTDILENMPVANLVGYWPLGDGDIFPTALDLSQSGNDGTMSGTLTAGSIVNDVPAPLESTYSLDFDGVNDSVLMSGSVSTFDMDTPDPRTLTYWIKPTDTALRAVIGNLNHSTSFRGWESYIGNPAGTTSFQVIGSDPGPGLRVTGPALTPGEWVHVAFTYDGSGVGAGVRVYHDGLEVTGTIQADDLAGASSVSTLDFIIGERHNGTIGFSGGLDGIAIYNKVLSPSEMFTLGGQVQPVDHGAVGPIDSLVGYWRMGDPGPAAYPTIADLSAAQDNPGSMTNMDSGDIVDDSSSPKYFAMRGESTVSGYEEWVSNRSEDFDGTDAPGSIVADSSVVEARWSVAPRNYRMRALADPGPGYVEWISENTPDFAGTNAPSAIQAGTAAAIPL